MNSLRRAGIAARKVALALGLGRGGAWGANDVYVDAAPNAQQTVDLFAGEWASRLPLDGVVSGEAGLFEDHRIAWMIDALGGVADMTVLELGPLEGGHSWMLERAGAAAVTAIEGNRQGYLKCLVAGQLLGLARVDFQLGDFDRFLAGTARRFDLIVASGVLYHLADPLATLLAMTRVSNRIFIWSHFADADAMPADDPRRRPMTGEVRVAEADGERLTYHVRSYLGTHRLGGFCGGKESAAVWLESAEVVALLERRGYAVTRGPAQLDHPAGPALCLLAVRSPP